jgi:hypothetical protein
MAVPAEIRKQLGDREPSAHASLSCGLTGPIGEVHFIVADGQLFVFERESLVGEFRAVDLDAAHPPRLEAGSFNDVLHMALADGSAHELQVSSFDRDAITALLDRTGARSVSEGPPPAEAPDESAAEPEPMLIEMPRPEPEPLETPAAEPAPETGPAADSDEEAAELAADKEAQKHEGREFHGSDPGCTGCLIQFVLFAAGVVALWFAHEQAMLNTGVVAPEDEYDESFLFVITKIAAVVAGMYLGGKLAGLAGRVFRRLQWTGRALVERGSCVVEGPRAKWTLTVDLSREFTLEGATHTSGKGEGKHSHGVWVRLQQDGRHADFKTTYMRARTQPRFEGVPLARLEKDREAPQTLSIQELTLRRLVRRLKQEPGYKSGGGS